MTFYETINFENENRQKIAKKRSPKMDDYEKDRLAVKMIQYLDGLTIQEAIDQIEYAKQRFSRY